MDQLELTPLTPREAEVLRLMGSGHETKALGIALGISEHTAKFHVHSIQKKFRVRNRVSVVVFALKNKLLTLDELKVSHEVRAIPKGKTGPRGPHAANETPAESAKPDAA